MSSDSLFPPAAIPDSQLGPRILGGKQDHEDFKNIIPEPITTPHPRIHQQPFDYDGEVYIGVKTEAGPQDEFAEEEEEEEEDEDEDNQLNPRGDVFSEFPLFGCLTLILSLAGFWVVQNAGITHTD